MGISHLFGHRRVSGVAGLVLAAATAFLLTGCAEDEPDFDDRPVTEDRATDTMTLGANERSGEFRSPEGRSDLGRAGESDEARREPYRPAEPEGRRGAVGERIDSLPATGTEATRFDESTVEELDRIITQTMRDLERAQQLLRQVAARKAVESGDADMTRRQGEQDQQRSTQGQASGDQTGRSSSGTQMPAAQDTAKAETVQVTLTEFEIRMEESIPAGKTTFEIANAGAVEHNFEIEGEDVEEKLESNLLPGESTGLTVDLKPGSYQIYCPVADHEDRGMALELTVTEGETPVSDSRLQ